MERGYLHSVVWIALVTLLMLLALNWLPNVTVGDWQMRRVDMLADLRTDSTGNADEVLEVLAADAAAAAPGKLARIRVDSCRAGLTCINDMADDEERGMTPLYRALDGRETLGRPVRIAVLGDSYIEGDILTANLRQLLQERYGGCGVGYVPITSDSPGFRRSVRQKFNDAWTSHNANDRTGYDNRWATLMGHYYLADNGAMVSLSGVKTYLSRLDTCTQSTFYFMGHGSSRVTATINGTQTQSFSLEPMGHISAVTVQGKIGKVEWRVNHAGQGVAYLGASMDCDRGVVVDNFSLRAAGGQHLRNIEESVLRELDALRHYDLVIIMYGLNVAGKQSSDYSVYRERMVQAIAHMKRNMPGTGFLVVSVGDREEKRGGGYHTMRGVVSIVNAQQRIAFDSKVAFWNLYTAMGGEGSVVRLVEQNMANLDYTHINFRGGGKLARLLFDAIAWGYEQYHQQVQEGGQP